ncbi:MAG: MFS transporter [Phycisphaeraceae bacterium]
MLSPLRNRTYRSLFAAQVIALAGTGLATVALALLAYQLAGADAGVVLGTALAIKMIAYVGVAPLANAYADRLPRRSFLVAMDVVRAAIALLLPFVDQVWQIYILIFMLQSASAAFTPAFQATIPDILPNEREYTRALSLSRLAYDLESLLSPALAAALLTVMSFHWLFGGTAIGFIVSACLILTTILPQAQANDSSGGIYERTTRGMRIYLATPRLRGLLALNLSAAAAGAMVIVNTVVYVQGIFQRSETDVALALAMFGGGSMLAALALPRVLDRLPDRPIMLSGAALMTTAMMFMGARSISDAAGWQLLLAIWFLLGLGYSAVLTPSGRLLRRSSTPQDRPAVFAAQFALSHACWLLTYPLAGWLGAEAGLSITFLVLGGLTVLGVLLALALWPADDPEVLEHIHRDLGPEHPHVRDAVDSGRGLKHAHAFVIDDFHRSWPARG